MYKLYQVSQIQAIIGGILDYTTTNFSFDCIFLE